jgi:hypothetical protein
MELRSHTRPLAELIFNPSDAVEVEYSFPAGNKWGREELKCLNVDFAPRGAGFSSLKRHIKDHIESASEFVQQGMALVGLT